MLQKNYNNPMIVCAVFLYSIDLPLVLNGLEEARLYIFEYIEVGLPPESRTHYYEPVLSRLLNHFQIFSKCAIFPVFRRTKPSDI